MSEKRLGQYTALPASALIRDPYVKKAILALTGAGGGTWGSITGTLAAQTDLQGALDAKISLDPTLNTVSTFNITQTTNNRIQAQRQLALRSLSAAGAAQSHVDSTQVQASAPFTIMQALLTGSDNPPFLSASVPEYGLPNGKLWFWTNVKKTAASPSGVISSYGGYFRDITRSTMVSSDSIPGLGEEKTVIAPEFTTAVTALPTTIIRVNCCIPNPGQPTRFVSLGAITPNSSTTILHEISNAIPFQGVYYDAVNANPAACKWVHRIRTSGDIHYNGTKYPAALSFSTNTTIGLDKELFVFTGGSGITLTLPDPTLADNLDRTHRIVNMGSADLTFSRSVYLDATTTQTILTFAHPSNKISIYCDGTKWIAIP